MSVDKKVICQDVIDRIRGQKFRAKKGNFLTDDTVSKLSHNLRNSLNQSAQDFVKTNECEGCAKGGLMLAYVFRYNNMTLKQLDNTNFNLADWPNTLIEAFGRELLDAIEVAFEYEIFGWTCDTVKYSDNVDKLIARYSNIEDNNERLIAIMQDIIDDKFVF